MGDSVTTIHTKICPVCGKPDPRFFMTCKDYLATGKYFRLDICSKCGFAFTQDFPVEAQIGRFYEASAYISHSDTNKGIVNKLYHWARKKALNSKAEIIAAYTSISSNGALLDIGSGTGYFLNKMKSLNWHITGVEKSDSAREFAKDTFDIETHESEYLYQIPSKSKDVITMWHVLEHMERLHEVMDRLYEILKDDGTAFIALPNKESFDGMHYRESWAAYDVPRHLWHFSPSDFQLLAEQHGFEIVETKPMYFDIFYISMLSEKNSETLLASIVGLIRGGMFFLRCLNNKKMCSSLIYILKKK